MGYQTLLFGLQFQQVAGAYLQLKASLVPIGMANGG